MQIYEGNLTRRGTLLVGLVLLFSVAGFILRVPGLLAYALLIVVVLVCAMLGAVANMRGLELRVQNPLRVDAGKRFLLDVAVTNTKRFVDSSHLEVSLSLPFRNQQSLFAKWIPAGDKLQGKLPVVIAQRSSVIEIKYRIRSSFPFGLVQREVKGEVMLQPSLIVYPRKIIPQELWSMGDAATMVSANGASHGSVSGEFRGVRPWQSGDAAKLIHWQASARSLIRGYGLRVREFDPPSVYPEHCAILFHSYGKGVLREDRFERAISFLAGALDHLLNVNAKVTLYADFLAWNPMHSSNRSELLELLALLAQTKRALNTELHEVNTVLGQFEPHERVIVISDLDKETWHEDLIDHCSVMPIDIRQVKFAAPRVKSAKEVSHA